MPRVPLVFLPVVPLGPVEIPRQDAFGSTSPVPSVGRSREDGGMPRPVVPSNATVVPPVLMPSACAERVATAAQTTTGESNGESAPTLAWLIYKGKAVAVAFCFFVINNDVRKKMHLLMPRRESV